MPSWSCQLSARRLKRHDFKPPPLFVQNAQPFDHSGTDPLVESAEEAVQLPCCLRYRTSQCGGSISSAAQTLHLALFVVLVCQAQSVVLYYGSVRRAISHLPSDHLQKRKPQTQTSDQSRYTSFSLTISNLCHCLSIVPLSACATTPKYITSAHISGIRLEPGVQSIKRHTRDVLQMLLQCKDSLDSVNSFS